MLGKSPKSVITGAGGGLGRAFAEELALRGSTMLLSDIDEPGLAETKRLVEQTGGTAHTIRCDVAKTADVAALEERARELLGETDLIINNAGVAVAGKVGEVPLEDWDWLLGINLRGVIAGCHFFIPAMRRAGHGHILNVASIAAFASPGEMSAYNVSKAGVVALSETLAAELTGSGVGVTVLCPYFFKTNILKSARSRSTAGDFAEKLMERSAVQARGVASQALGACEKDELYVFPHKEAKLIAALKRSAPETMIKKLGPWLASKSKRA